jgi:hypothetical protein
MRKSMQEIRQDKRKTVLAEMQESVTDGSLRIRQMTPEERLQHSMAQGRFANKASRKSSSLQRSA